MKQVMAVVGSVLVLLVLTVCASAGQELPDELTLNVGEVKGVGTNVTVVLRKHSMRSANYLSGLTTDGGFKKVIFPVSTYRGHVKDDPCMYVNGNIEPGGVINLNFTENRLILAMVRGLKISIPAGTKCTPDMTTGNKVVPLKSLKRRQVPTSGGYIIPEAPMRQSRWSITVPKTYTEQFELEKVVSQVEQRWNDGDFIYARDAGTAWEIETLVLEDPKSVKPTGQSRPVRPGFAEGCLGAGVSGVVVGKNHGKIDSVWVIGAFLEAGILLHESAHLYDNPMHQLDTNDGLCGGGAYWAYNNVAIMVESRKARYHETNFPGVIYGTPIPPHATYDFANTRKDTPVTIDVLENDYDGNGDALSVQAVVPKSVKGGTCAVSKDGQNVIYTPAPGFVGADKFTYTVVDSTGLANRSGEVKVDVRTDGLAAHFDFEDAEEELIENRRSKVPLDGELDFYDKYDSRPKEEKLLYHLKNLGPYDSGYLIAQWFKYYPVKGIRGKGIWNPGLDRKGMVNLGDAGDPGRGSLSASVWVLYPRGAIGGGGNILHKGGHPAAFVNGWAIAGGGLGGSFEFRGNSGRMLGSECFSFKWDGKVEPDTWYHLVLVMDREKKQARAWVNNEEVKDSKGKVAIPDGVIECYGPLQLFNAYTGKWWHGDRNVLADEVKIFTSVLTEKQVAALYAEGKDAQVPVFPELPKPEPKK